MTTRPLRPDLIVRTIVVTGVATAILTATVHPLYQLVGYLLEHSSRGAL